jgi:hypothetical protein
MVSRPSVLVANPDPGIRRLLRWHFGNAGYNVMTAELGRTALYQIRRNAPLPDHRRVAAAAPKPQKPHVVSLRRADRPA